MSKPLFTALTGLAYAQACLGLFAWAVGYSTGTRATKLPPLNPNIRTSLAIVLAFSTVALLLYVGKSRGPQTRRLALFLLLIATPFADVLLRNGHHLGGLSNLFDLMHLEGAMPVALWQFALVFPVVSLGRAEPAQSKFDILAIGPIVALSILFQHASTEALVKALHWPLLILAMLPAVPVLVASTRSAAPGERRRVAIFLAGILLGLLPMGIDIVLDAFSPGWVAAKKSGLTGTVVSTVAISALMTVPVTTAFAVLVARAFDFRLVLRTAARYALAQTTLLLLILVPLSFLAQLVYENRSQTVGDLLSGPTGLLCVTLAALAAAVLFSRHQLLAMIDRRFFRDVVDSETLLTQAIEHCRVATSRTQLATLVTNGVSSGLKTGSAAFLAFDELAGQFVTVKGNAASLRADSGLIALLENSDLPLTTSDTDEHAVVHRIDPWSREWLRTSAACLVVPARNLDGRLMGILVLGAKKSDLAYTSADRQVLSAIGSAAGLRLGQLAASTRPPTAIAVDSEDAPARECPECGLVHSATAVFCTCGPILLEEAEVPQRLMGKYSIHRRIGSGGGGVVYGATHDSLLTKVAVKTRPRSAKDQIPRLRREAQMMARGRHAHVAEIYDFEMWRDRPCLVVELLERGTLADRLASGPLPLPEVSTLGRQIAEGLKALHKVEILHRDVKPSNIGFTSDGTAKLLDFGLARPMTSHVASDTGAHEIFRTRTGDLWGTPAYLAPEVLDGEEPSQAHDLWALGVVLLESATGRHPFQGRSIAETCDRIRRGIAHDGIVPTELGPFGTFIRAALDGDKSRRPASAADFMTRLADTLPPQAG